MHKNPKNLPKIAVIGSGPSGVSVAWKLIHSGLQVEMLDVGLEPEKWAQDLCHNLLVNQKDKAVLANLQCRTFQEKGHKFKKWFGSNFTYKSLHGDFVNFGQSYARGGLSRVWGANCLSATEFEIKEWGLGPMEMALAYKQAGKLLCLPHFQDNLDLVYFNHSDQSVPPPLDQHSQTLLEHWNQNQKHLNEKDIYFGRSKLAISYEGDNACNDCGLCFYGCPRDSIYSSVQTLRSLNSSSLFKYRAGILVKRFRECGSLVYVETNQGNLAYDYLFVAAGTLSNLQICAQSLEVIDQEVNFQDQDMFILPFVNQVTASRKFHQEAVTLSSFSLAVRDQSVSPLPGHLQLYYFSDYLVKSHKLLNTLSRVKDLTNSLGKLMLGFFYLPSPLSRKASVKFDGEKLVFKSNLPSTHLARSYLKHLLQSKHQLGIRPLSTFMKTMPLGRSAHPVGTIPMNRNPGPMQTDLNGRLYGTKNVFICGAAVLPFVGGQNTTFTIMANDIRMASNFVNSLSL